MEVDTNGHIVQGERGISVLRREGQFAILIATPEDTSLEELHVLKARQHLAFGGIGIIEHKRDLLSTHDAHCDVGFFRGER